MTLRYYQEDAVRSLFDYFTTQSGNPVVAMPTGTGKSVVIAAFIQRALMAYPTTRIICLTHVKELVSQNAAAMQRWWQGAPVGIYSAGLKQRDTAMAIIFAGIASVKGKVAEFGRRDIIIIDECHLLSQNDSSMYQTVIEEFRRMNPYVKVIGLSATPYRMGQGLLTDDGLFTDFCFDITGMQAFNRLIDEGYLSPPFVRKTDTEIDTSTISMATGEFAKAALEVQAGKVTLACLREMCFKADACQTWLIFAAGIEHAETMAKILNAWGVKSAAVHSKLSDAQRNEYIRAYKAHELRCLVNQNVLTTGFDFPPIDFIGMMRPTMSTGLWCLDSETEILTERGFLNRWQIAYSDQIASIDTEQRFEYTPMTGFIERELAPDEFMVSLKSTSLDIRVSNKHRMLIETRSGRKHLRSGLFFVEAETLQAREQVAIPTAARIHAGHVSLTDDQLRLIGYYLTDGTIDKKTKALTLYQSERYPAVITRMRECLTNLNLKFGEYIQQRTPNFAMHRLQVSYGEPRATQKSKIGYGVTGLAAWFDKDFPIELMNVSAPQFTVLLDAINDGDGSKSEKIDWIRRTYTISTGNRVFAERLQITALKNGYRCNISSNGLGVILLYIKKQRFNVVTKSNDGRAHWRHEDFKSETIWCVENKNGTIITRRNGKVTVMGNCQMIGRGTRPSPGTHKTGCQVLDFAGNARRLGPINDPFIPKRKGAGGGDAPARICPACNLYCAASARECMYCGYVFDAPQVKLLSTADEAPVLASDLPQIETFEVKQVFYSKGQKKGNPPYMNVSYSTGLQGFKEVICLEHHGFAGVKARNWWRERHNTEPPATVDEALTYQSALRIPRFVRVIVNRPHPEVVGYEY